MRRMSGWRNSVKEGLETVIKRLRIEPEIHNECHFCGMKPTTAEGLLCRRHWDLADGVLKQRYQAARIQILNDVFAKESLR